MPRLMSVSLTEPAVVAREKTVTRRLGWWLDRRGRQILHPGDRLTLCRKVQGRRRANGTVEPLVRLADVRVISVRREPLDAITAAEVAREGFPQMTPAEFVEMFTAAMRCQPDTEVTRIAWAYLDPTTTTERSTTDA